MGGASTDLGNHLWVDSEGNTYVAGSFSVQAKFYKTEVFCAGGGDVFVTKLSKDGIPVWVRTFGGKLDDFASAITGDPEGNIYISGIYTDSSKFGDEWLVTKGADLFVAKLTNKGQLTWVKGMKTAGSALIQSMAVTEQGAVYIGGLFSGSYSKDQPTQLGMTDGFVTKLDWQGNPSWTKIMGGAGFDEVNMLSTDAWGRVVVAGNFDQMMALDDKLIQGSGAKSAFIARIEATSRTLWAKGLSGGDGQAHISDATTDLDGTVFITGKFSGECQFGDINRVSNGQTDLFVLSIKSDGFCPWVLALGGKDVDEALSIRQTPDGKSLIVSGLFNTFLESGRKNLKADFDNQVMFARIDKRGNLDELRKEDFHSTFQCAGHFSDGKGNLWVCGSFTGKANFGKTGLVSAGEEDIFVASVSDKKIAR